MPYRIIPFVDGYFYHIYNRGTEKRRIFEDRRDYQRIIKTIAYYQLEGPKPKFSNFNQFSVFKPNNANKIVQIASYCLMPNHFHLLIKQSKNGAITEFMTRLSLSYTKFYNTKYSRIGPLFQGEFKAVLIESDEQLMHVSRYIHLNPLALLLVKNLDRYEWSSYAEYVGDKNGFCSKDEVLGLFKSPEAYKEFVLDQAEYSQSLEIIKHQILDDD